MRAVPNLRAGASLLIAAFLYTAGLTDSPKAALFVIVAHVGCSWLWDIRQARYVSDLEATAETIGKAGESVAEARHELQRAMQLHLAGRVN